MGISHRPGPVSGPVSGPVAEPALTPREREVFAYVAAGRANKVIAIELGISMRTVEIHRARIFRKFCVRNAAELARRLYGGASGPAWLLNEAAMPYGREAYGFCEGPWCPWPRREA
ncbi:hypothetical protein AMP9_4228 [plant metagenome]|uniref:HTH luxR-type domain-containing protein n=1 Tax=plant metagenome TaxID=1297885 RepID=A0A484P8W6_9ZZZZ